MDWREAAWQKLQRKASQILEDIDAVLRDAEPFPALQPVPRDDAALSDHRPHPAER